MNVARVAIGALSLSAVGLVGLWNHEGWLDRAAIPVQGDVLTVGPGLTKREDGTPVQMGDTIKPLEGARRSLAHIQQDEKGLKTCVTAPLHQAEYDPLVSHAYQFGVQKTCWSQVVKKTNAGDYAGACEAYLSWRFVAGRDCSLPGSGCRGVWLRAKDRRDACMAVQ